MTEPNNVRLEPLDATSSSLLERVQAQDSQAWQRLVDLYGPLVYHWCRRHRLQAEDMADVFQEVFRAVASHITAFRRDRCGDNFRGWLLTITRNKIHDHFRRQQRQVQATGGSAALQQLAQVPDPVEDQQEAADADQERDLLRRALHLLRDEFEDRTWQAFWRVTVEGQASADVAADLCLSLNAVYKAKSRVLQRFRQELGDLLE
jgi:RNA polymerase sigma-70 factor, ECF subfamily